MSVADPDATPVLDFVVLRAPEPVPPAALRSNYIHDGDFLRLPPLTHVPEPPSLVDYSTIGAIVFQHVFRADTPDDPMEALVTDLLATVGPATVQSDGNGDADGDGQASRPLKLEELGRHAVIVRGDLYYVLPSGPADVNAPLATHLLAVAALLRADSAPDRDRVLAAFRMAFGDDLSLAVFADDGNGHRDDYVATVRALFEALYLLYVLRRQASIDLGGIIAGLRLLHLLEALVIDEVVERGLAAGSDPSERDGKLLGLLVGRYPMLRTWDGSPSYRSYCEQALRSWRPARRRGLNVTRSLRWWTPPPRAPFLPTTDLAVETRRWLIGPELTMVS